MKVRKKPVVIDAWPIADLLRIAQMGAASLPKEVRSAYTEGLIEFEVDRITIATTEGVMTGWEGWWLMLGTQGEWYPCQPDAFEDTFEIVEATDIGLPVQIKSIDPYASSPEV